MSFSVTGGVGNVLATALDGVTLRQQVTANNIANVDTPDFRAQSVDFESSLRQAIDDGSADSGTMSLQAETLPTDTPVGANGNNVDLRKETLAAVQSQYQYQMLSRAVNDQFNLVREAIGVQ